MSIARLLLVFLLIGCVANGQDKAPKSSPAETDAAAINAFYAQWSHALATRGAEGYAAFFSPEGAVLPPDGPAIEGQDAILKWIQKVLDETTIRDARMTRGPMHVNNGIAVHRFTIAGLRVPKKGGDPVRFNNKYLDVIQKQPDGTWKFLYRMWSSSE